MDKTRLRSWAKQVRRGLNTEEISTGLIKQLARFLRKQKPKHILLYSAFGSEVDVSSLQTKYKATYYLPRVENEHLHIHPLPCELVEHKYGFLEPAKDATTVEVERLEAVLVPGLTFDLDGYRIGYGKGFYDRFLQELGPRVLTIGVVADLLFVERVARDPWDVPVQYIVTELGITKAEG